MTASSRPTAWWLCAICFAVGAPEVRADKIVMKNGRVIQCVVLGESDKQVEVDASGARLILLKSDIQSIEKLDPAANALAEGDRLFAAGKHDAAIESYSKALSARRAEAELKIAIVRQTMEKQLQASLAGMPPDEAEKKLRARLAALDLSEGEKSQLQGQLAGALLKRAELADLMRNHAQGLKYLEEAWQLRPETPGLAVALARAIEREFKYIPRIAEILEPYVQKNPDDMDAIEILVRQFAKSNPWAALKLVYPNGKIHPKATASMKDMLPDLLVTCFNAKPYPPDAPLDPVACYERLMELRPETSPLPLLEYKVQANPNSASDWLNLGRHYRKEGKYERAIAALEKAVTLQKTEETERAAREAKAEFETREMREAHALFTKKQILEAQVVCESVLLVLAESKQARALLQQILNLEPCSNCAAKGALICESCRGTGGIYRVRARFKIMQCSRCGSLLAEAHIVDSSLPHTFVNAIPWEVRCLRCSARYEIVLDGIPCSECETTGYSGTCPNCEGTGLLTLKIPRKSKIDLSRYQRAQTTPTSLPLALAQGRPSSPSVPLMAAKPVATATPAVAAPTPAMTPSPIFSRTVAATPAPTSAPAYVALATSSTVPADPALLASIIQHIEQNFANLVPGMETANEIKGTVGNQPYVARNLRFKDGKLLSCTIVSPIQCEFRR